MTERQKYTEHYRMNAQYNWIDIMENPLFDFVADVRREVPYAEIIQYWFGKHVRYRWFDRNYLG